jgi:hypothetical protein
MKVIAHLFCAAGILAFSFHRAPAAPAATNQPVGFRLIVELQDGSKIIGQSGDDAFQFRSDVLGEMKLPLEHVRSIACQPKTNSVQLATVNGDILTAQFVTKVVRVETAFGGVKLPVNLIRRLTVSPAGKPGQIREGLVALWSGEGDGNDSAGGNPAILMGDISFAEGEVGQAFSLNGFNSCLRIPFNPSLNVGESDGLTITAWIRPSNVSGFHPIIEWNPSATMTGVIGVQLWIGHRPDSQGVLQANIVDAGGGHHFLVSPPGVVVNGRFQHVAVTYDKASGIGVLYLNGAVVAQSQWDSFVPLTKGDLWISRRPTDHPGDWTYNKFFAGLLDELAIYNRALPASEIQTICTEENNGEPLPPPTPTLRGNSPVHGLNRDFIQN